MFFLFQNVLPNMFVAIQGYEVAKKYCLLWYFGINIRFSKWFASNPSCKGGGSARYNPQVHTRCKQEIHGENIEVTSPYLQMFIGSSSRTEDCDVYSRCFVPRMLIEMSFSTILDLHHDFIGFMHRTPETSIECHRQEQGLLQRFGSWVHFDENLSRRSLWHQLMSARNEI